MAEAGNCFQRRRDNDERAAIVRKGDTAVDEVITPEERILNVAAGRNKPAKSDAEETVEGARNAENGKVSSGGMLDTWTRRTDVAKRRPQTPWKAPWTFGSKAGQGEDVL